MSEVKMRALMTLANRGVQKGETFDATEQTARDLVAEKRAERVEASAKPAKPAK
ncbi:MAG: hypothetical protein ACOCYW_09260 [Roseicyclus sp.]